MISIPVREDALDLLDIGSGTATARRDALFPNSRVHRLDIAPDLDPDILQDITEPLPSDMMEDYDVVLASHVFEHIERIKTIAAVQNVAGALRKGGEFWMIVPALEWAASNLRSPVLIPFLYGSQTNEHQYHRSGYTLLMMRSLVEYAGLTVRHAYQGKFEIDLDSGDGIVTHMATENVLISAKL